MPTLPGVQINDQAKFDRVVAAFGTQANFQAWQRQAIIDETIRREIRKIIDQRDAEVATKNQEAQQTFGTL